MHDLHLDDRLTFASVADLADRLPRRSVIADTAEQPLLVERRHGRDYQVVTPEFVDDNLIGRAATSEPSREAIEDGKDAGAASPLGLVELTQGVEAVEDRRAPDRLMRHALGREGFAEMRRFLRNCEGRVARYASGHFLTAGCVGWAGAVG